MKRDLKDIRHVGDLPGQAPIKWRDSPGLWALLAGLPLAMLIGLSYALWAGLCVALIAFTPKPPPVRPRAGLLGETEGV